MKKTKRLFLLCLALVMLLTLVSCKGEAEAEMTDFTVTLKTEGGMPFEDLTLRVYAMDNTSDLVWGGSTDKEGRITFQGEAGKLYLINPEAIPEGYEISGSLAVSEPESELIFKAVMPKDQLSAKSFGLGDVMTDFTLVDTDGTSHTLSELLKEKKAVVLNFWFLGCEPCRMEFPFMQEAYEECKDSVEILAINPYDGTNETVSDFKSEMGLTFPCVSGEESWQSAMSLSSYPTTVIIDRYGMIASVHKGAITSKEEFVNIFEYFTADDYVQGAVRNISEIE